MSDFEEPRRARSMGDEGLGAFGDEDDPDPPPPRVISVHPPPAPSGASWGEDGNGGAGIVGGEGFGGGGGAQDPFRPIGLAPAQRAGPDQPKPPGPQTPPRELRQPTSVDYSLYKRPEVPGYYARQMQLTTDYGPRPTYSPRAATALPQGWSDPDDRPGVAKIRLPRKPEPAYIPPPKESHPGITVFQLGVFFDMFSEPKTSAGMGDAPVEATGGQSWQEPQPTPFGPIYEPTTPYTPPSTVVSTFFTPQAGRPTWQAQGPTGPVDYKPMVVRPVAPLPPIRYQAQGGGTYTPPKGGGEAPAPVTVPKPPVDGTFETRVAQAERAFRGKPVTPKGLPSQPPEAPPTYDIFSWGAKTIKQVKELSEKAIEKVSEITSPVATEAKIATAKSLHHVSTPEQVLGVGLGSITLNDIRNLNLNSPVYYGIRSTIEDLVKGGAGLKQSEKDAIKNYLDKWGSYGTRIGIMGSWDSTKTPEERKEYGQLAVKEFNKATDLGVDMALREPKLQEPDDTRARRKAAEITSAVEKDATYSAESSRDNPNMASLDAYERKLRDKLSTQWDAQNSNVNRIDQIKPFKAGR